MSETYVLKSRDERKNDLIKDLQFMRKATPEQIRKITLSGMSCYAKAVSTFGIKSPVAKESLSVVKEMLSISKIEEKLLRFIEDNIDSIDVESAEYVVDDLDSLNSRTYIAYDGVLEEIENACEMKKEDRALNPNRSIDSLLNNNQYKAMVLGLTKKLGDVKSFLNYEEEFWAFISTYLKIVPCNAEGAEKMCGIIPISTEEGNLCNFYTLIPQVVDLDTAMIAIRILKRAHDLYLSLGNKYGDIVKDDPQPIADRYQKQVEAEAVRRFK